MQDRQGATKLQLSKYPYIRGARAFAAKSFYKLKVFCGLQGNLRRVLPKKKTSRLESAGAQGKKLFFIPYDDGVGGVAKHDIAGSCLWLKGKNIPLVHLKAKRLHPRAFAYGCNIALDDGGQFGMPFNEDAGLGASAHGFKPHRAASRKEIQKSTIGDTSSQRVEDRLPHLIGGRTQLRQIKSFELNASGFASCDSHIS